MLMDVIMCEAPCCPGLREYVTNDAPHLGQVVTCQPPQKHYVRSQVRYETLLASAHRTPPGQMRSDVAMSVARQHTL